MSSSATSSATASVTTDAPISGTSAGSSSAAMVFTVPGAAFITGSSTGVSGGSARVSGPPLFVLFTEATSSTALTLTIGETPIPPEPFPPEPPTDYQVPTYPQAQRATRQVTGTSTLHTRSSYSVRATVVDGSDIHVLTRSHVGDIGATSSLNRLESHVLVRTQWSFAARQETVTAARTSAKETAIRRTDGIDFEDELLLLTL